MRTKQVLKTVLLSEMTLSLFGFVTCLQSHISLSDECDTPLSTSECFWLRLNRQSFYHYRKRQLVPTDRYRFRSIGKLIGSVSHDRVAYRYLDAFPKMSTDRGNFMRFLCFCDFLFCLGVHSIKCILPFWCVLLLLLLQLSILIWRDTVSWHMEKSMYKFVYSETTGYNYKNVPVFLRGTFYTYSVSANKNDTFIIEWRHEKSWIFCYLKTQWS